jgi:hypothetical protein
MAVDSRAKGARAETVAKDFLKLKTGLKWERVPGSGGLHEKHGLKGDLYIPNAVNYYCVEVKHYAEDHVNTSLLTGKDPQLLQFWKQTVRESGQVGKTPLLIFKHDRSKLFCAFEDIPSYTYRHIFVSIHGYEFFVALLEDWLAHEAPKFTD